MQGHAKWKDTLIANVHVTKGNQRCSPKGHIYQESHKYKICVNNNTKSISTLIASTDKEL